MVTAHVSLVCFSVPFTSGCDGAKAYLLDRSLIIHPREPEQGVKRGHGVRVGWKEVDKEGRGMAGGGQSGVTQWSDKGYGKAGVCGTRVEMS